MFVAALRKVETTLSYFQTQFPSLTAKPHTTSNFHAYTYINLQQKRATDCNLEIDTVNKNSAKTTPERRHSHSQCGTRPTARDEKQRNNEIQ